MGIAATGAQSVLTLNVLTANVSEALEMLAAAVRLGGAHLGV
jgi:selenophosphate synthetase-related protein